MSLEKDWQALQDFLQERYAATPLALAYSGGLDSRFLAHALHKAGCDVKLYHATGAHVPHEESAFALIWAQGEALPVSTLAVDVSLVPHVQDNSLQRCYYCKKHLMLQFLQKAEQEQRLLCDGTNADDLQAHRPGLRALQELHVHSPLALHGLSKQAIRALAEISHLHYPQQKASPCLLTRLAYGMRVEPQLLARIDAAENALHRAAVAQCRVRVSEKAVLVQIQTSAVSDDISGEVLGESIQAIMAAQGFGAVDIVYEENLSGYFDRK